MQLEAAYGIELDSFLDLIRLITNSGPDRPSTIFKWSSENMNYTFYGSFAIFPGYYNYEGLPVIFFVKLESSVEELNQTIVRYNLQSKENQIEFLSHLKEQDLENVHTGLIRFCPIVRLKKAPKIFTNLN